LGLSLNQAFCKNCGTKLTESELRFAQFARNFGPFCKGCFEKEREKQLRAMGYFLSLDEARLNPDNYVIIEGDDGAICYLVYPAKSVKCDEGTLRMLAHDLEGAVYPGDTSGAKVRYKHVTPNEEVDSFAVGEDAGLALQKLWLPKWLSESGLDKRIQQILDGEHGRLDLSLSEQTTVQLLHKEYHARKFEEDVK
jgi:hypothetical protein